MTHPHSDEEWLAAAARLALRGRPLSRPNPAVGCIVVQEGRMVGRGWTQPGGRPHAEAMALTQAGDAARDARVYVTLEPCAHASRRGPACADLLVTARPASVIVGVEDPDPRTSGEGLSRLQDAGIDAQLLECPACEDSVAGYLLRRREGRPHVTLKLAATRDGRLVRAEGQPRWITDEPARAHVHSRRALADAILVGGETWRVDAPGLDVRLAGLEQRSPARIVLTRGATPNDVQALSSPQAIRDLDGIQYLYVEGGAGAASAFVDAGLVDRVDLYRAPFDAGEGADVIGQLFGGALDRQDGWCLVESATLGSDSFAAYQRVRS